MSLASNNSVAMVNHIASYVITLLFPVNATKMDKFSAGIGKSRNFWQLP